MDCILLAEGVLFVIEFKRSKMDRATRDQVMGYAVSLIEWLYSPFQPSSSILDATLSLYGNHDVAAIQDHAAPKGEIDASIREIRQHIDSALVRPPIISCSCPAPVGAGKTLVGLDIVTVAQGS